MSTDELNLQQEARRGREAQQILEAVSRGSKTLFHGISGVGKKTVEKLFVEIREKSEKRLQLERGASDSAMLSGKKLASTASVSWMQDLEEAGLLAAPHVSAGRMPTETGLRLFVDGMMHAMEPSIEERAAIERLAESIRATTRADLQVVVIPTTAGAPPRTFATDLFNRWRLGNAERNDGLLLFVALADRRSEIILGDGIGFAGVRGEQLLATLPRPRALGDLTDLTEIILVERLRKRVMCERYMAFRSFFKNWKIDYPAKCQLIGVVLVTSKVGLVTAILFYGFGISNDRKFFRQFFIW